MEVSRTKQLMLWIIIQPLCILRGLRLVWPWRLNRHYYWTISDTHLETSDHFFIWLCFICNYLNFYALRLLPNASQTAGNRNSHICFKRPQDTNKTLTQILIYIRDWFKRLSLKHILILNIFYHLDCKSFYNMCNLAMLPRK